MIARLTGPALFLALWLGFQALGERFLLDPGTFWHVATGEKILHEGFLAHDPYTFTFAGTPWIPYQWLGEIVMALAHRVGGLDGVLVLATAAAAALFAWLGTRFVRVGLHPIFAAGLLLVALAATANHFHARPLLATMILMAWTTHRLLAFEAGRIGLRGMAWLVPAFAVWANIHGGMLGGLATFTVAVAGWSAFALLGLPSPIQSARTFIGLAGIGVLCTLTMFANPYGVELPKTWRLIMSMPKLPELIVEHARFTFADPRGWPMLAFAGLYLFCLAGVRHLPRVAWLLPLVWLIQAMLRVRHGSLFTVVGMVALADLWPHTRWAQWLAVKRPDAYAPAVRERPAAGGIALTAIACVAFALGLQASGAGVPLIGNGSAHLDPKAWPTELLPTIKEHEPTSAGDPANVFNDYQDGGFLIHFAPGYRVFVDDRCEVFGDDWLEEFVRAGETAEGTAAAMDRWQERYGPFAFALTRADTEFDKYFAAHPETWQAKAACPTATFYARKRP